MAAKIYFKVIQDDEAEPDAITMVLEKGAGFSGSNPDENLACGGCKEVFGRHLTTRAFIGEVLKNTTSQCLLRCHCGALNLIKSKSAA